MSIPEPSRNNRHEPAAAATTKDTKHTHQPRMSPSDAEELKAIDAACERISKALPEYPYLLSAPPRDDQRYHYPSLQEAHSWCRNTPFYRDEERLQYMSYVYREPSESCYQIASHPAADEERNKKLRANGLGDVSRPGTPGSFGHKKKISLAAYQKSKLAEAKEEKESSPAQEAASSMEVKEVRLEKEVKANGVSIEKSSEAAPVQLLVAKATKQTDQLAPGVKRSRLEEPEQQAPTDKLTSAKKQRLSPPPLAKPSLQPSPIDHPNGTPHGLPALLSPTNPFAPSSDDKPRTPQKPKSSSNPWGLPEMLSPTLPPKIEAELAREKEHGISTSTTSSPALKSTPSSSVPNSAIKAKSTAKSEGTSHEKVKDTTKEGTKSLSSQSQSLEEAARKRNDKMNRPSLVVKLHYGDDVDSFRKIQRVLRKPPNADRNRFPLDKEYVDRLLSRRGVSPAEDSSSRLVGKPSLEKLKDRQSQNAASVKESQSSDTSKKARLHPDAAKIPSKTAEKRPRPKSDESEPAHPLKKQKLPSVGEADQKNPRTPTSSNVPSPSVHKSGSSVKRDDTVNATPRAAQLKAVAMARSTSTETPVATPGKQSHLTPLTASKSRAPTSAPGNHNPKGFDLKAIMDLSVQYNKLGRKLKHENQDINNKKGEITEPERKRAALLGMESILAYMIAYALGDSRRRSEGRAPEIETSWRSLIPLFKFVRSNMRNFKPLDGLYNYLGMTINARIVSVISERLAQAQNAPLAADSPQSVDNVLPPNDQLQASALAESYKALSDCARDGASRLPVEDIMAQFPTTWANRSVGPRDNSNEMLTNEKGEERLQGLGYWLPMGIDTPPVQAVRFGVQLIKEWIRVEELGYEPRIRI